MVSPLFVKCSDLFNRDTTALQICTAVARAIRVEKVEGAQRINHIWRLYVKDRSTRVELYTTKYIIIEGKQVPLYDQNPAITGSKNPEEKKDKLTIKNVPLSVSNHEIETMLIGKNVKLASAIKYGYIRDEEGSLTSFKSGDRFVYVEPFEPPLPRNQQVGQFPCILIHHGK